MSTRAKNVALQAKKKRSQTFGSKRLNPAFPSGLKRYLGLRGTPNGVYEITRTVTGYWDATPSGIVVGAASYDACTFVVDSQSLQIQSGIAGNTTTIPIPNAAELSSLWDKLKIDRLDFTFMCSAAVVTNASNQTLPFYMFAFDSNDRTASTDIIKQMPNKTWMVGYNTSTFKMSIKPQFQRLVYYTAVTSSYEPTRGYVVSDTAIPHYGLKFSINQTGAVSNAHRVYFSVDIHFKLKELK